MPRSFYTSERLIELKSVLRYEPETGLFWWLIRRKKIRIDIPAGTTAGTYVDIVYKFDDGMTGHYTAHRLVWWFMTGEVPKEIDHIDGDRMNNRWVNLRRATHSQNMMNKNRLRSDNSSGHHGVGLRGEKWVARIFVNGEEIWLGRFNNIEDAIAARKAAELEYFGDYKPGG